MDLLERTLGHDRWTTERLLTLSQDLSDAQLDREFDVGHRTLRNTFDHMILNVEFWTGLMVAKPIADEPERASVADMRTRHARSHDQFANVARDLVASGRLDETFIDHYSVRRSFGATILHVVLHNAQHRSEGLHILQRLGLTDLPDGDPQEWEYMMARSWRVRPHARIQHAHVMPMTGTRDDVHISARFDAGSRHDPERSVRNPRTKAEGANRRCTPATSSSARTHHS